MGLAKRTKNAILLFLVKKTNLLYTPAYKGDLTMTPVVEDKGSVGTNADTDPKVLLEKQLSEVSRRVEVQATLSRVSPARVMLRYRLKKAAQRKSSPQP